MKILTKCYTGLQHSIADNDTRGLGVTVPSQPPYRREHVNGAGGAWAAVHVWGFPDAPVSWHGAPHGRGPILGGENDYTLLLLPGDQYVLFVAAGEGDSFGSIGGHRDEREHKSEERV